MRKPVPEQLVQLRHGGVWSVFHGRRSPVPFCPSSGVGNTGPSSPQGPNTILVLIVKDVLWSLLQCFKKTGKEGGSMEFSRPEYWSG